MEVTGSVVSLVNRRALREVEIRGTGSAYNRLDAARAAFLDKVEASTASITDLLNFVLLIDNVGHEVMPGSEGMDWIIRNPDTFAEIVGDVDVFLATVVQMVDRTHPEDEESDARSLGFWFLSRFIGHQQLLALLSPEWRERYVRELYPRFGAWNNSWVAAAVIVGVPRSVIAHALLERLRRTEVRRGAANDVDGFLQYGSDRDGSASCVPQTLRHLGAEIEYSTYKSLSRSPIGGWARIERTVRARLDAIEAGKPVPVVDYQHCMTFPLHHRPTEVEQWDASFSGLNPWSVLSNNELEEALLICAEKAPAGVASIRQKMLARLDETAVEIILASAVGELTSLFSVSETELARLSLAQRKRLAERLVPVKEHYLEKVTAQFLFRLIVELPREERRRFYETTVSTVLAAANAQTLYAAWAQLGFQNDGLEYALQDRLREAGIWIGTIRRVPNPRRGGTQLAVEFEGDLFVQANGSHRYFPTEGDRVMFNPNGRQLTSTVMAVNFTPVMKDVRD